MTVPIGLGRLPLFVQAFFFLAPLLIANMSKHLFFMPLDLTGCDLRPWFEENG